MWAEDHSGQVLESGRVSRDDLALCGMGGRGDDQVMRSAGLALPPGRDEQQGMGGRDRRVVADNRDGRRDILDESSPRGAMLAVAEFDTYEKLGDGNRRDRHVIFVVDDAIERRPGPVGVDQERRVE
jgi:hypothetical protein